jgi:hypothetical protein
MPGPDRPPLPIEPPIGPVTQPPGHWPSLPPETSTPRPRRAWAAVAIALLGAVIGTIAAFAPWATYIDGLELTGTEHGDGWIVLLLSAAAAALSGALGFGWRHLAVRLGLVGASLALLVVFTLNRVDISRSHDRVTGGPIDVGGGLYGVVVAACLVLAGALIIPTRSPAPPA